jgi:hypothetical protein
MLEDWEARELASIEQGLRSDPGLVRRLAGPTRRERRWCRLERRFYPRGFLLGAVVYMLLALGGGQLPLVLESSGVGLAVWVVLEARVVGVRDFVNAGLQGIGKWLHG